MKDDFCNFSVKIKLCVCIKSTSLRGSSLLRHLKGAINYVLRINNKKKLSQVMRKLAFYICKIKGTDQLSSN